MPNKKGISIVELMISLVIIGIISTFTIVTISRYLSSSKLNMDKQMVISLNEATTGYYILDRPNDVFDEEATSEENIMTLYTEGFLSSIATPNSKDAAFIWDGDSNTWYLSIDGSLENLSPYGNTPSEIAPKISNDIISYYENKGSYPRTWGDYQYSDIGLNPEDWKSPINHIYYRPSGSKLFLEPEDGYQFILETVRGVTINLTSSLNYNLIYNTVDQKWYYHSIEAENEVIFETMSVTPY